MDSKSSQKAHSASASSRRRSYRFIAVFVVCVLAFLTGYRFIIPTRANDWYLFHVAKHTAWALGKVGEFAELEPYRKSLPEPAVARAAMAAWQRGQEAAAPDDAAKMPNTPLTAWERFSYKSLEDRHKDKTRVCGPSVTFVLKYSAAERIRDAEARLAEVKKDATLAEAERTRKINEIQQEMEALRAQKGEKKGRGYSFPFIVVSECGAIEVMAIFFAAIMAFPTRWWRKLIGVLLGIPIMYSVNIFRLTCLAIIGALTDGGEWFDFSHQYVWQAIYIVFVVAVWLAWIEFLVNRKTWVESYLQMLLEEGTRTRNILVFSVKFLASVSLLVLIWWKFLPYYGTFLLQTSGTLLKYVFGVPIDYGYISPRGLFNTGTKLIFHIGQREPALDIALLVTNIPPYIALVLATAKMGLWRRLRVLLYGCGILITGHVLYIAIVLRFQDALRSASEVPTAIIQFFLTLPFLLWIIFAYWDQIINRTRKDSPNGLAETTPEEPVPPPDSRGAGAE